MSQACLDNYSTTFATLPAMLACYQSVVLAGILTNLAVVPLAVIPSAYGPQQISQAQ